MSGLSFSMVQERARQAALAGLAESGLAAAAVAAIGSAQAFLAEARVAHDLGDALDSLACGPGCSPCCHQAVTVTVAELALVEEAIGGLAPTIRARAIDRARAAAAQVPGIDPARWWALRLACPLLDEGRCRIHDARPLPCRAMNSADAGICRRAFDGEALRLPVFAAQHRIYGSAQEGLAAALAEAGQEAGPVTLAAGLARG